MTKTQASFLSYANVFRLFIIITVNGVFKKKKKTNKKIM